MRQKFMRSFIWAGVFAVVGACMAPSDPQDGTEIGSDGSDGTAMPMFLPDGLTRATPQQTDPFEEVRTGEDPSAIVPAKDCVYIQWCNEPGPNGTICRLRAGCKYNTATVNECTRDTYNVCGHPVQPWYLF